MKILVEFFLNRSIGDGAENNVATTTTPKDAKKCANTLQNDPKSIQNDLKIARKRFENCTLRMGKLLRIVLNLD